ncbi:MAG: c-type cytochrome [Methylobacteriaceae bacterium]|nr:c-type cytochrome [Methylobacteriaceae bacterium]
MRSLRLPHVTALAAIAAAVAAFLVLVLRTDIALLRHEAHFDVPIRAVNVDLAIQDSKAAGAPVAAASLADGSVRLYPTVQDRAYWTYALAEADPARGAAIWREGTKAGAAPCGSCHGGVPGAERQAGVPAVAGLDLRYVAAQLQRYGSGARANEVMASIAAALSAQDRADVAAFAASLQASPAGSVPGHAPEALTRGAALDRAGNDARRIAACSACHGPAGGGGIPRVPALSGQDADYLANRLRALRAAPRPEGSETTAALMQAIASRMGNDEITAAATFYASAPASPR